MKQYYCKEFYLKEAIIKAAYQFTDRYYIHLDSDERNFIVDMIPKTVAVEVSENEFSNELIAQMTRFVVLKQTCDIRKIILARAFASTIIEHEAEEKNQFSIFDDQNEDKILSDWFVANEEIKVK